MITCEATQKEPKFRPVTVKLTVETFGDICDVLDELEAAQSALGECNYDGTVIDKLFGLLEPFYEASSD